MADTLDTAAGVAAYMKGQGFDPTVPLRQSVAGAMQSNPDQEARLQEAARVVGVSALAARVAPDQVIHQARLQALDFGRMVQQFPNTAGLLLNQDKARLAHDDVPTLQALETAMLDTARYVTSYDYSEGRGLVRDVAQAARAVVSAIPMVNAGMWGVLAAPFGAADQILQGVDNAAAAVTGTPQRQIVGTSGPESWLLAQRAESLRVAKVWMGMPADAGFWRQSIMSGFQSAGQNFVTMPLGLWANGERVMLGMMGATQGGQSYAKAREAGVAPIQSAAYGFEDAVAEVVGERYFGAVGFMRNVKAGSSAGKLFAYEVMREVPGEVGTTLWQNFNEWANVNPDKSMSDWLREQPEAVAQTIVATLVGGGTQIGAVKAIERAALPAEIRAQRAQQAQQTAVALAAVAQLAEASKLRERDPAAFAAFAQDLADQGVPAVHVEAKALLQSGVDLPAMAQAMPSVAAQFEQALQTGGDVVIPTGELLAAGGQFAQALTEHVRTGPDSMSRAEATAYLAEHGERLQAEVQRAVQSQEVDSASAISRDAVRDRFAGELQAAGRTADVARAEATLLASFYATQGARLGMTAEQMAERYPLRVQRGVAQGAQVLEQITPEQAKATNVPVEMPAATEFAEAVDNTPGAQVTSDGLLIDLVRFQKPEQEGAEAVRTGVFYLPKGSPSAKHYKTGKTGYGGTEKFEGPTLLRRPLFVKGATGGKAPEAAYIALRGKDAFKDLDKAVMAVLNAGGYGRSRAEQAEAVEGFLEKFAPDRSGYGGEIERVSRKGNTLRYALQELAVAYAVREAGHDAVVGYSKGKAGASISEVFDVREQTFPARGVDSEVHSAFWQQARGQIAFGADITASPSVITLLKTADLSTFIHETGHFFLQVQADIAARLEAQMRDGASLTPSEQQVLDDARTVLQWLGVQDTPEASALTQWHSLTVDQQRDMHEKFARGFERYAFEGKAPSVELQGVFQRFRAWLVSVYRQLVNLKVELTPEVRSVMDRMLASDDQIRLTEQGRSLLPLFADQQSSGMTPEEWAEYQALGEQSTADAVEELQGRALRDMQWLRNARGRVLKRLQREAEAQRREVRAEVRVEVMREPVYRAWTFLTGSRTKPGDLEQSEYAQALADWQERRTAVGDAAREKAKADAWATSAEAAAEYPNARAKGMAKGQFLARMKRDIDLVVARAVLDFDRENPKPAPLATASTVEDQGELLHGKLNIAAVDDLGLPAEARATLKKAGMLSRDGLSPDMVAGLFGFTSGDELARTLAAATPPAEAIAGLTDQRMLERYGDLATPAALERAADAAVANEARGRMIAAEAAALDRATGPREVVGATPAGRSITRSLMPRVAREWAQSMIGRLRVRDIRPGQYTAAEARAARNAAEASRKGDLPTAAAEKRNQLVQHYAAREANAAQDEVAAGLRYLRKFDSDGVRKGLDADYTDQIDALLERFDLRQASNRAVDRRAALAAWVQSQTDRGMEPDIAPELLNEANRQHYKNLTLDEFRGLVDAVRQIEHLGRLKHRLLTTRDQRAFEAVRDEIADSITEHAGSRQANTRTPTTALGRVAQGFRRFWAAHIKVATWAHAMDGGQEGPLWEHVIRPANEAGDREATMRAQATSDLSAILAPVFKAGKMGGAGRFFPTIGRSLNREAVLAIALNTGNEGNLQRLLDGDGWTLQQVLPVLQSLTAAEWHAVQQVWDYLDTYRPLIAAKERRVYGKEPTWVEPRPFAMRTADGKDIQLRGGYYPVKYDPAASQRAEEHADAEAAKRQLQGAYTSATTRRSFTKARAEAVKNRPLLYTMAGLYSGVNDVVHDLSWHEWLIDVNRLLRSGRIDEAIREHYGPEAKQQFKTWVQDIAEGERGADGALDMALGRLRQGISAAGLGFNVMSAAMQPLGITQSIVRVGAPWIGRGLARYLAGSRDLSREVQARSEFMANRMRTRFRELAELRNRVQDQNAVSEVTGRYAYWLMMQFQGMVDVPTWWGAYEKALAAGHDDASAVARADQAVIDSQGGGQTKDLSAIERGGPAQRLFTVFYSFMNTALNLGVAKTMAADTPAKRAKLAADYLLLFVVPAVLGQLLKDALTPGDAGDGDDLDALAKRLLAAQIDYLMGLMVVAREFSEAGKTLTGANDRGRDYTGPAGLRLVADSIQAAKQIHQGEFDDALRKALVNLAGDLTGLPAAQVNRTITGAQALSEGQTENPVALVFGFQHP